MLSGQSLSLIVMVVSIDKGPVAHEVLVRREAMLLLLLLLLHVGLRMVRVRHQVVVVWIRGRRGHHHEPLLKIRVLEITILDTGRPMSS